MLLCRALVLRLLKRCCSAAKSTAEGVWSVLETLIEWMNLKCFSSDSLQLMHLGSAVSQYFHHSNSSACQSSSVFLQTHSVPYISLHKSPLQIAWDSAACFARGQKSSWDNKRVEGYISHQLQHLSQLSHTSSATHAVLLCVTTHPSGCRLRS